MNLVLTAKYHKYMASILFFFPLKNAQLIFHCSFNHVENPCVIKPDVIFYEL